VGSDCLARYDERLGARTSDKEITEWISAMKELLAKVMVGEQYVCLDGLIIPTDATLDMILLMYQVAALEDPNVEAEFLCNPAYWQTNAVNRE